MKFVFFGGEPLGAPILEALITAGHVPTLVVCNPDRPTGRKQILTAPPVKKVAEQHGITTWQPTTLTPNAPELAGSWDVFIVVAYNKILPDWLIDLPTHKTINVHPSLLPKLRGASPIRSAILRNEPESIGVSIMVLDSQMDHGPLLAQQPLSTDQATWPLPGPELDQQLIKLGAKLLIETVPKYLSGAITPIEQDHAAATYCGRLSKDMAELTIDPYHLPTGEAALAAYRTIQAFSGIGDAWFAHEGTRYKIKTAHLKGEQLVIDTVVPAGASERAYNQVFK